MGKFISFSSQVSEFNDTNLNKENKIFHMKLTLIH
jgi:hypothetical protein